MKIVWALLTSETQKTEEENLKDIHHHQHLHCIEVKVKNSHPKHLSTLN